jgi:predicted transcriptional regulator
MTVKEKLLACLTTEGLHPEAVYEAMGGSKAYIRACMQQLEAEGQACRVKVPANKRRGSGAPDYRRVGKVLWRKT